MKDLNCILAGITRLLGPLLLLILWHKRTHARFAPAPIAFAVCFPVFILGNAIRSGFVYSSPISYYIQQALLFGVLEESAKFIILRFALSDYDTSEDAVTYGIGHSSYEEMLAAFSCFGLVGQDTAHPAILPIAIWTVIAGTVSCCAKTVMIMYGIRESKTKIMLPAAILLHAAGNASNAIFVEVTANVITTVLLVIEIYIAYRCRKAMQLPGIHKDETDQPL